MGSSLTIPETINVDEIIENTGELSSSIFHRTIVHLGLSKKQINALWKRFYELDRDAQGDGKGYKNYLNAGDLSRVPKFDENPIAPRLIDVILEDYGSNGRLTFAQFVNFMTTFGQTGRGGHDHHHHHSKRGSLPSAATKTSSKTDAESVKFSLDDTPKTRKVKFIFRVRDFTWIFTRNVRWRQIRLDVRRRSRWTFIT